MVCCVDTIEKPLFFKLELSKTTVLTTKATGILPYRPQYIWVFSIMKGTKYMASHMVSHFIECHLLFAKETVNSQGTIQASSL